MPATPAPARRVGPVTGARRAPAPHADTYVPRPYGAPRPADTVPAPARAVTHVTERVPGASAVTSRVRVTAATPAPRLAPVRDIVPLRPTEHASRQRHGVPHAYVTDRDGFVSRAVPFGGTFTAPASERMPVTHDDGTVTHVTVTAPAPASAPHDDGRVTAARPSAVTVGPADARDACATASVVRVTGAAPVTVPVDGDGRIVRTVGDDAPWSGHVTTRAPAARRAPRTASAPRDRDVSAPPARVSRDVVVMWIRATGYAGPVDARMVSLARDAMAAQRQRDAYASDDDA